MPDMLDLSAHLPEFELAVGDTVVLEGGRSGGLWVLVSGALGVWNGDAVVGTITRPGALVGVVSLLLGTDQWTTVRATEPSQVRYAADGNALLYSDQDVITLAAIGLAHRLTSVTAYLADLECRYGDAPGLSMVNKVLGHITVHDPPTVRAGSARDPERQY